MTAKKIARLLLGLGFAALFAWLTLRHLDLERIGEVLRGARLPHLAAAVLLLAAGYACRIARWRLMLLQGNPLLAWRDCAGPLLAGFAANNVLPFRAGDLMRAFAFNRRLGTRAAEVAATLFVERLLDLLMMLALLGAALWWFGADVARLLGVGGPLLLAAAGVVLVVLLRPQVLRPLAVLASGMSARLPAAGRLQSAMAEAMGTLSHLAQGHTMPALLGWSAAAWLLEGGVYLMVAAALAGLAAPQGAVLALPVGTMSTLIPSTPGYVGTFDFFTARAMGLAGNEASASAAFAFLAHFVLWLPPTVAGGLYLLLHPGLAGAAPAANEEPQT